jgi:hypothetical protein
MKSTTQTASSPARSKDQSERQQFFKECYLALLSSALSQFEVRNRDGDEQLIYDHVELAEEELKASAAFNRDDQKLAGKVRQIALQHHIDKSEDLAAKMREEDSGWREEEIIRRCYRMAKLATDVWFEEQDFASKC